MEAITNITKISSELSIPLVATNDTYYTYKEDAESCDIIRNIGLGYNINDPKRSLSKSNEYYIKSSEEMLDLFKSYPDAINNTKIIADQCNVEIKMDELYLPPYTIPENSNSKNADEYLLELCNQALEKNILILMRYLNRLKYELIIEKMGFASYFLITQDFVRYAKTNDIPVGPGEDQQLAH